MGFDRYYRGIVLRVILISLIATLLAFLSYRTNYVYCIISTIIVIFLLTWNLISFIIKRRNMLKSMLDHIKENNATINFSKSYNPAFAELGYFLNEIGEIVRQVRRDKENQLKYTQYIVEHVDIGLISFDNKGKIEFINPAAKKLLSLQDLISLDQLERVYSGLQNMLLSLKPNGPKVFTLNSGGSVRHLALSISFIKIAEKDIKLVSLQDIKHELDEKEIESWQKLTRVLTHEITNSITPVTSLTGTITNFFKRDSRLISSREVTNSTIQEVVTGLELIEERGNAVLDFVQNFKSLTKLPKPEIEEVNLLNMIENIARLKKDDLVEHGVVLECKRIPNSLTLLCDQKLLEHVFINLVNNAIDAFKSNHSDKANEIIVQANKLSNNRTSIHVIDNGIGIPESLLEDIFIPFFTTKDDGNGIGLSLSRQIIKLHGGSLSVKSEKGKTVFLIEM